MNSETQMTQSGTHIGLEIEEYNRLKRLDENVKREKEHWKNEFSTSQSVISKILFNTFESLCNDCNDKQAINSGEMG